MRIQREIDEAFLRLEEDNIQSYTELKKVTKKIEKQKFFLHLPLLSMHLH